LVLYYIAKILINIYWFFFFIVNSARKYRHPLHYFLAFSTYPMHNQFQFSVFFLFGLPSTIIPISGLLRIKHTSKDLVSFFILNKLLSGTFHTFLVSLHSRDFYASMSIYNIIHKKEGNKKRRDC
jgi:hypothetical protein